MWIRKPYKEDYKITSPFGDRVHPVTGEKKFHKGIDITMPEGTELFAPIGGKLTRHIDRKGLSGGFGRYVMLKGATAQNNAVRLIFAHLETWCAEDDGKVLKGNLIAKSGNTGSSTGDHLHLQVEIWNQDLRDWIPINPVAHIDFSRFV